MATPHRCPVCQGRGLMPYSFYHPATPGTSSANMTFDETCHSCGGVGILWSPDDEPPAPQPAPVQPRPYGPINPFSVPGVMYQTLPVAGTVVMGAGTVSFTALQGIIPVDDRRSSVDPRHLNGGY